MSGLKKPVSTKREALSRVVTVLRNLQTLDSKVLTALKEETRSVGADLRVTSKLLGMLHKVQSSADSYERALESARRQADKEADAALLEEQLGDL